MRASENIWKIRKPVFINWGLASIGGTQQHPKIEVYGWRPNEALQWRHPRVYVRQRFLRTVSDDMCLAIPGRILDCQEVNGTRLARVQFGGIVRSVSLDFVPEADIGEYVMVHVGFAISRVAAQEAERTYRLLAEMGALEEELSVENSSRPNLDTD